jgi:hypothetical protein
VVWNRQLDTEPKVTCPARGITATAAVLPDPVTGVSTVYISGARFLYALNAATGAVAWKTGIGPASPANPDAYYNWSSPTVAGTSYGGSVRQVNPATGVYLWQTGLPCAVTGTPSLDSAGVLAAGTYFCPPGNTPGAYLINAATGAILKTLAVGSSRVFGQPVFAKAPYSSPRKHRASMTSHPDLAAAKGCSGHPRKSPEVSLHGRHRAHPSRAVSWTPLRHLADVSADALSRPSPAEQAASPPHYGPPAHPCGAGAWRGARRS